MGTTVEIRGISKSYVRNTRVLNPVDLTVQSGELFFLLAEESERVAGRPFRNQFRRNAFELGKLVGDKARLPQSSTAARRREAMMRIRSVSMRSPHSRRAADASSFTALPELWSGCANLRSSGKRTCADKLKADAEFLRLADHFMIVPFRREVKMCVKKFHCQFSFPYNIIRFFRIST